MSTLTDNTLAQRLKAKRAAENGWAGELGDPAPDPPAPKPALPPSTTETVIDWIDLGGRGKLDPVGLKVTTLGVRLPAHFRQRGLVHLRVGQPRGRADILVLSVTAEKAPGSIRMDDKTFLFRSVRLMALLVPGWGKGEFELVERSPHWILTKNPVKP